MTIQEIKAELERRQITIADFADKLKISYSGLRAILSGRSQLTDQLHEHICLALGIHQEQWVMYKVTVPDDEVDMLIPTTPGKEPKDKEHLLEVICKKNLDLLAEAGRKIQWTDEQKRFLGLPTSPTPAPDSEKGEPRGVTQE